MSEEGISMDWRSPQKSPKGLYNLGCNSSLLFGEVFLILRCRCIVAWRANVGPTSYACLHCLATLFPSLDHGALKAIIYCLVLSYPSFGSTVFEPEPGGDSE